jgi:hypothetical protein
MPFRPWGVSLISRCKLVKRGATFRRAKWPNESNAYDKAPVEPEKTSLIFYKLQDTHWRTLKIKLGIDTQPVNNKKVSTAIGVPQKLTSQSPNKSRDPNPLKNAVRKRRMCLNGH